MILRLHLTPVRMAKIKNTSDTSCCWIWSTGNTPPLDMEHGEWSSIAVRRASLHSHYGNQYGFSENWEFIYLDPAISLLDINLKDTPSYLKDTSSAMFIAALLIIDSKWKQTRCPSSEEWIKKMWCIYIMEFLLSCYDIIISFL